MPISDDSRFRTQLFSIGLLAGFCAYVITEYLPDVTDNKRVLLFTASFAYAGFISVLMLAGAISWRKTIAYGIPLALVTSLLLLWNSFRFDVLDGFYKSPVPVMIFAKLVVLALPFVIAAQTAANGWRDYPTLFRTAWGLFVKAFTAVLFVGVFWGVMWTSAFLLGLVDLDFLEELIKQEVFWLPMSGAMFGLALAVLHEMANVVDTMRYLLVRLLRLLLPLVAVVIALFLVFVPVRGLDQVFGNLSAAGTVLAMSIGSIALITATLDATNDEASHNVVMLWAARILSALLPVMAAIAVYALWLRVDQYGWTPERLMAVTVAVVVLAYALVYAGSVLFKPANWQAGIRQGNVYLAVGMIGVMFLWLTPVLNAQRISANSQLNRYVAGVSSVSDLGLWELKGEWGKAGQAALEKLRTYAVTAEDTKLSDRLAKLDTVNNRWDYDRDRTIVNNAADADKLVELVTVLNGDKTKAREFFGVLDTYRLEQYNKDCSEPDSCFLVFGDIFEKASAEEAFFILSQNRRTNRIGVFRKPLKTRGAVNADDKKLVFQELPWMNRTKEDWNEINKALKSGDFSFVPAGINSLKIGDTIINPYWTLEN
jgi:uncharacterized protein DUF4153